MTTSPLYATGHITGTVSTPSNVLGAPNGTWTTDADNTSWDSRFAMDTIPAGQALSGTQTIAVTVRKETGSGTPTFTVELWENGAFVATLASGVSVTSTTGQSIGGNFAASAVTNPANVEVRLIGTASGGSPSARSTPQVDGITWTATYVAAAVSLTVADSGHGHTADAVTLTQHHSLAVADAGHGHTAEPISLTQHGILTVADSTHGHAAEAPTLTVHDPSASLVVDDSSHGHTAEPVALTQHHVLEVANSDHGHTVETPGLVQHHQLAVADTSHWHSADTPALTQHHAIAVSDTAHGHTTDNPSLTQHHPLDPTDGDHGHTADGLVLTAHNPGGTSLTVADTTHGYMVEAPLTLIQHHVLVVAECILQHAAEQIALEQHHVLAAAESVIDHAADQILFASGIRLRRSGREPATSTAGTRPAITAQGRRPPSTFRGSAP